ncbi:hypothetical protein [Pantoea septica]|uniref:hypothetical protein n=1 Tax=Pantoea septica TaxID=472695 RepID=UPI00117D78A4|nr:hypothetical protein [Pantoea septica]
MQISITPEMTKAERRKENEKLRWFSLPTKEARLRRIVSNMAACAFGGTDIDDSTPGAIQMLMPVLKRYSMLVYQTASHTAENPRLRIVPEYSRLVEPKERQATGEAVDMLLMQEAGFTIASIDGDVSRWVNGPCRAPPERLILSVPRRTIYYTCPESAKNYMQRLYNIYTLTFHRVLFPVKTSKGDNTWNVSRWPHYSFPAPYSKPKTGWTTTALKICAAAT